MDRSAGQGRGFNFSNRLQVYLLAAGFIWLILLRQWIGSFGVSVGYLYLLLITVAGLRSGWRGGLIAALAASLILLLELMVFRTWPGRDLILRGVPLRILAYLLQGVIVGHLSNLKLKRDGHCRA